MASTGNRNALRTPDARELEAQHVACRYLLKGCERALFHFGLVAGETGGVDGARVDQRAAEIMRLVLSSWRDALSFPPVRHVEREGDGIFGSWMVIPTPQPGFVPSQRPHGLTGRLRLRR